MQKDVGNLASFIFTSLLIGLFMLWLSCFLNISINCLPYISSCLIIKALLAQGNDTVLLLYFLDSSDNEHRQEHPIVTFHIVFNWTEENIADSENGNLFLVKICVDSFDIPYEQLKYRQSGLRKQKNLE